MPNLVATLARLGSSALAAVEKMPQLVVDQREHKLVKLLGSDAAIQTLDVGDVRCTYDDGTCWVPSGEWEV